MAFQPTADQQLLIDGVAHRIAEHPAAPGMPYGQEGRQAVVYQVVAENGDRRALKVFKPRFRAPALVGLTDQLAAFADLPGLSVCRRAVLTPRRHTELLRQQPDLTYAVLMPWIAGPTWMEVVLEKQPLSPDQSLSLARGLAGILAEMEERGLAHCDLSGPNVLLPALAATFGSPSPDGRERGQGGEVSLVDVEQMYGPGLNRPQFLPGGSSGYAHKTAPDGLWAANADRFAGAVLMAEMLGWCDTSARESAWGESFFDPAEMQQDTARYRTLLTVLRNTWGEGVASLFERAWHSETLADCATFGEWLVALPETVLQPVIDGGVSQAPSGVDVVNALLDLANRLRTQSNFEGAREAYHQVQRLATGNAALSHELSLLVAEMEEADHKVKDRQMVAPRAVPIGELPYRLPCFSETALRFTHPISVASIERVQPVASMGLGSVNSLAWVKLDGKEFTLAAAFGMGVGFFGSRPVRSLGFIEIMDDDEVAALAPSPDSLALLMGTENGKLLIQRSPADLPVEVARWDSAISCLASSTSSALVAVGLDESDIPVQMLRYPDMAFVYDCATLDSGLIRSVALSSDEQFLAGGLDDGTVCLWNTVDGQLLHTIEAHQDSVWSVAFSPEGNWLASGSEDGSIKLWQMPQAKLLGTLALASDVESPVTEVAFAPAGSLLAASYEDSMVRLWDAANKRMLTELEGHLESVATLAFAPDGFLLASGASNGTVILWGVS